MELYFSIAFFILFALSLELLTKRKYAYNNLENSILPREYKHTRPQIAFFLVVMFVLWFLTAFRSSEIGNDTKNYIGYFNFFGTYGINSDSIIEIGYQIFNILVSKISSNPQAILIATATVCYIGLGIYVYKYSDNLVFSTVLLFPIVFSTFTNILRQSIAMVIILYAYQALKKNRIILSLVLIILASTFHTSTLIVILLLLYKIIPKKPIIILPLAVIFILLSITGFMDDVFSSILPFYAGYYENEGLTDGWIGMTYYCLRNLVFYLLVYFSYRSNTKNNSLVLSNFVLLLLATCFGFSLNIFNRASEYFLLISIVELPNAINRGRLPYKKMFIFLIGFIMVLYFIVTLIIRPDWNTLCPYKFFWN